MEKTITGRAWKFADNVDTDQIIPAEYLVTGDPKELAKHAFEKMRPEFASSVKKGDVIAQFDPQMQQQRLDDYKDTLIQTEASIKRLMADLDANAEQHSQLVQNAQANEIALDATGIELKCWRPYAHVVLQGFHIDRIWTRPGEGQFEIDKLSLDQKLLEYRPLGSFRHAAVTIVDYALQ